MAKKITKKRLKELVSNAQSNALDMPAYPPISSLTYTEATKTTFSPIPPKPISSGDWGIEGLSSKSRVYAAETRQNRLDLYDGTAELLLKLTKNIDNIKWVNQGAFVEGKGRGLRILVEGDFLTFFTSPFFGEPESITGIVISQDLEEKILLRANTSVPNLKVLKLLNEL